MNISVKSIFSIVLFFIIGYNASAQPEKNQNPLVGSWELVKYIDHGNNGSSWESYNRDIVYQKHITDTHFIWVNYDQANDQLIGMGGGTYLIDNTGRYIENIQFFYPPGSSELGQSIPFEMYVNKDKWMHTGYAKNMEYTPEGDILITDSTKIEEEWRSIPTGNNDLSLVGTWDLVSYREKVDDSMIEYPEFIVYMKIITGTHFIWVQYDNEGDQVYALGAGKYTYDGAEYVESLDVTYPKALNVKGMQISFSPDVNTNKWLHKKVIMLEDGDSLFIDEVWVPKETTLSEITAFIK